MSDYLLILVKIEINGIDGIHDINSLLFIVVRLNQSANHLLQSTDLVLNIAR